MWGNVNSFYAIKPLLNAKFGRDVTKLIKEFNDSPAQIVVKKRLKNNELDIEGISKYCLNALSANHANGVANALMFLTPKEEKSLFAAWERSDQKSYKLLHLYYKSLKDWSSDDYTLANELADEPSENENLNRVLQIKAKFDSDGRSQKRLNTTNFLHLNLRGAYLAFNHINRSDIFYNKDLSHVNLSETIIPSLYSFENSNLAMANFSFASCYGYAENLINMDNIICRKINGITYMLTKKNPEYLQQRFTVNAIKNCDTLHDKNLFFREIIRHIIFGLDRDISNTSWKNTIKIIRNEALAILKHNFNKEPSAEKKLQMLKDAENMDIFSRHRNSFFEGGFGDTATVTYIKNMWTKETRDQAFKDLQKTVGDVSHDPLKQMQMLIDARNSPVFNKHRNSFFWGGFGKTASVVKIDKMIAECEKRIKHAVF